MPVVTVGVDGSQSGLRATRWAAHDALRRGVALRIVAAWRMLMMPFTAAPAGLDIEADRHRAQDALESATKVAADIGVNDVDPMLVLGAAGPSLCEAASASSTVVVGTRGLGPAAGTWLGSVSHHLMHHTTCPAVIVPPDGGAIPPRSVAVGVDSSPHSRAALHEAVATARRHHADLTVVASWHSWSDATTAPPSVDPARFETQTRRWIASATADLSAEPPPMQLVVTENEPAWALQNTPGDLLVVGTRGLGAFRGALLGSVSRKLSHHAERPVMVVHVPE